MMRLALCLFKYFPYGGLQRDFLKIALLLQQRGHQIDVYTLSWQGPQPASLNIHLAPVKALTRHRLYQRYYDWLQTKLQQQPVDGIIGFNKMPGLDVYYAADSCFEHIAQHERPWYYRYTPRYRHFANYEAAVLSSDACTEIMIISEVQRSLFSRYYQTQATRIHLLPPGISRDRQPPAEVESIRAAFRRQYGIGEDERLALMIGSGFKKKGLDRTLIGLAALPDQIRAKTHFIAIGQDNPKPFLRLAKQQRLERFTILAGQDDITPFLWGADLMVHPARDEIAGIILLEGVVAGLPVLTTATCGYATHINAADAGVVLAEPFNQADFNQQLATLLSTDLSRYRANGLAYGQRAAIYDLHLQATDLIETSLATR